MSLVFSVLEAEQREKFSLLMLHFVAIPDVLSLTCSCLLCVWSTGFHSLLCSRLLIQARHDSIHRIGGILGCYWMMGCKHVHVNGDSSSNGNEFESFSDIILI